MDVVEYLMGMMKLSNILGIEEKKFNHYVESAEVLINQELDFNQNF